MYNKRQKFVRVTEVCSYICILMEFVDTHTHNYDSAYDGEQDAVIERAVNAGVTRLIQADVDSRERPGMFELVERHPGVLFPMLGLYPGSVDASWQEEIDKMLTYSKRNIVAIGEIGLDYHFDTTFRKEQKDAFYTQLELAAGMNLPVNIHLRDATEDFLDIIKAAAHLGIRGNLHAFSASKETFRQLCRMGDWYVGIGGVLTFRKASIATDIEYFPMDRILLETDSPYLAPTPLRGTRNESANIPLIAAKLAQIKGISIEDVAAATTENARKLFSI